MECQKHLFQLPEGIHYLNCGYMSPLMKSVEEKGMEGMRRKRNPISIKPVDFFTDVKDVRRNYGRMVNCTPSQVAVMPAVSYGMNSVIRNIPYSEGQHALTISEEFPSCYYTAERWCRENGAELRVVARKDDIPQKGKDWNERILEAIDRNTAFIVMSSVHWMNGTDVQKYKIDALICAAYKWLMGPYSTALSYIHEDFNGGIPLEESWMTRPNAERFDRLTNYVEGYKPGATRYDVGQSSNFISVPMLNEALEQLLNLGAEEIQDYCGSLAVPLIDYFLERNTPVDDEHHRAHHLMGHQLPDGTDGEALVEELQRRKVYVSLRGSNIRISINVFNTEEDIQELITALDQ